MADDAASAPGRPRRSIRAPARFSEPKPSTSTGRQRQKSSKEDPEEQLRVLLEDVKSPLTTMNLSDIINANTWNILSVEARTELCKLLPPTAFRDYKSSIEPNHPSRNREESPSRPSTSSPPELLDTSVFTDSHFLAAMRTFQDHLYTGWLTPAHKDKVRQFEQGIKDGSLCAPFKDELWEQENANQAVTSTPSRTGTHPESSMRAGEAAEIRLVELAKNGVIRVGDVLAYKRTFSIVDLTIEKDAIIESIHPKTRALTVLLPSGTQQHLPSALLAQGALDSSTELPDMLRSIEVTSPTMLETGLLDSDGRVDRARRPNGNAWKCLTVWRWGDEYSSMQIDDTDGSARGGRENHGTLFYLRGCYYHDR